MVRMYDLFWSLFMVPFFVVCAKSFKSNLDEVETIFANQKCIEGSYHSFNPTLFVGKVNEDTTIIANVTAADNGKSILSQLHELAQFNEIEYFYELKTEEGPAHSKTFTLALRLGDESYEAEGPSLKSAKRAAAAAALQNTNYDMPPAKNENKNLETPTVQLNNIANKLGIKVSYELLDAKSLVEAEAVARSSKIAYEGKPRKGYLTRLNDSIYDSVSKKYLKVKSGESEASIPPFFVRLQVDRDDYVGIGKTVQEAKHEAAVKALEDMRNKATVEEHYCNQDGYEVECKLKKEAIKSPISQLHEFGQKHKMGVEFEVISESGPAHKKLFVTRCTVAEFVTDGEGKSKKESKRVAAEKMLEILKENAPQLDEDYSAVLLKSKTKKKKKSKKMIKNTFDKLQMRADNVLTSLKNYAQDFVGGNEQLSDDTPMTDLKKQKKEKKSGKRSNMKDEMLRLAQSYGIGIQFADLNKKGDHYFSLMSMDTRPPYVCLGEGSNLPTAHNKAAFEGLRLIVKLGIIPKFNIEESTLFQESFDQVESTEYFLEDVVESGR